jgi:sugar O-acyltransferase (sialic acid O-acetyltransferase NeuD family)
MTQNISIIGAGGLGREFLDVVEAINGHELQLGKPKVFNFLGFVDDTPMRGPHHQEFNYLGSVDEFLNSTTESTYVIGIGDLETRQLISSKALQRGFKAAKLVHPKASLGLHSIEMGEGSVICANASLTTNIRLGAHVHINLNSTIGHDTTIDSFVSINPGVNISGNVKVGQKVMIGTGATVLQGLSIGSFSTIGAGALVTKNIPESVVAVGVPAKSYTK